jgi:hypothetical protein
MLRPQTEEEEAEEEEEEECDWSPSRHGLFTTWKEPWYTLNKSLVGSHICSG